MIIPLPKPKIKAKVENSAVYEDIYRIIERIPPATMHTALGLLFLKNLAVNGIDIAYIMMCILVREGSEGKQC